MQFLFVVLFVREIERADRAARRVDKPVPACHGTVSDIPDMPVEIEHIVAFLMTPRPVFKRMVRIVQRIFLKLLESFRPEGFRRRILYAPRLVIDGPSVIERDARSNVHAHRIDVKITRMRNFAAVFAVAELVIHRLQHRRLGKCRGAEFGKRNSECFQRTDGIVLIGVRTDLLPHGLEHVGLMARLVNPPILVHPSMTEIIS